MKERIFIVRLKNHRPNNSILSKPLVEVSYTDVNKERHMIHSFALKEADCGIIAGELMARLIPQLGDK